MYTWAVKGYFIGRSPDLSPQGSQHCYLYMNNPLVTTHMYILICIRRNADTFETNRCPEVAELKNVGHHYRIYRVLYTETPHKGHP